MASGVPQSHNPGGYFAAKSRGKQNDDDRGPFTLENKDLANPLVKWSHATAELLYEENQSAIKTMERNRRFYDGKQWAADRPAWKNSAVINYCSYVVDHWAALLNDNRPKFVYESIRLEDQQQAEIVSAMRDYDSDRDGWDLKREEAVWRSRVDGRSYITLRPDTELHNYEGGVTMKVIPADNLYKNKTAKSIEDASYLLYEYHESKGSLLSRYKKLRDFEKQHSLGFDQPESGHVKGEMISVPAQNVTSTGPTGSTYEPNRQAPSASRPGGGGSKGCLVREWWLRPKGPANQITVTRSKWRANGKLSTKKRYIDFEDGTKEPLHTVILEGNTVYELPMSIALMLDYAGKFLDCPRVLHNEESLDPVFQKVKAPLYPQGRRIIVVGDVVADDGANPLMHGRFPFVELRALWSFEKGACGDIDRIYQMQEYLNRLYALLMDCAQLTANPITIIPTSADLADEDITNAPGAILRGDPLLVKLYRRLEGPNMPAYVQQQLTFTIGEIRTISGLSEVATGGKFKGQQSAETVSMYQESASVIFRQGIRHMEMVEVEMGRQYLSLVKQFYSDTKEIRIKDALGIDRHVLFTGSEISDAMTMKSKAGSQLPSSPSAKLNTILSLFTQGITDIPEILKHLQEVGAIDSSTALMRRLEHYVKHPQEAWKAPVLFAMLNGGNKKSKGNQKNAGRSARNTTANKAMTAG